jgi:hypothetical protein
MDWKKALVFVLLVGIGICPPLLAAPLSRVRSLTGVDSVRVVVEDLNHATQKTGLRKEQIQAAAEKFLLEHGLKVARGDGGMPVVYLRLSSVIGGEQAHAPISFYLTVQVKQFARLTRARTPAPVALVPDDPPLLVTTWEDGAMVMLDRQELGFYVSQVLANILGTLVQDYQEANEKNDG